MCLFRILILVGLSWCKYFHVQYLFVKTFVIRAKTDWSSTKKIQLNMLVSYKVDLIIISFKINLFSAWYGWKIDGLALNNNHSHKFCMEFSCDKYDKLAWQNPHFPFFMSSRSASTRIILYLISSFTCTVYCISDYQVCWVHTSCLLRLYVGVYYY